MPQSLPTAWFKRGFETIPYFNYQWGVDLFLSGVCCLLLLRGRTEDRWRAARRTRFARVSLNR